jgi:hypothetical protein
MQLTSRERLSTPVKRAAIQRLSSAGVAASGCFLGMGLLALAFLYVSVASAATPAHGTYYIANSGNDSNSGTSPSTPWQTLAKLNAVSLAPGSAVYLQCGSVFRESLELGSSGSSSAPISYGSYGTCTRSNLPLISGADLLTSWTTTQVRNFSVYGAIESSAPAVVFEDNRRLAAATSIDAMTPGSFYYDPALQMVYARMIERDTPGRHVIEASVRPDAVVIESVSYIDITDIEADKATINDILAWGSLTNVNLTGTVTKYSYDNGIWFTAGPGQTQDNVLIKSCTADYNGGDGLMKGGMGNNFVIQGCTANYNAFDLQYTYTGGIRFISVSSGLYRPTNSGALGNIAAFNGVNPDTGAIQTTNGGQQGTGVWCDTCGDGSFLKYNTVHDNAQNGALLEFTGATGSLTMSYNIAYNNGWAGIEHSRSSHNDLIANNTSYNNQYNCYFSGQFGGGDTTIGMVNNTYENNICAGQVSTKYGNALVAQFGAENNALGQGSGNIYRDNSLGSPASWTGRFASFGSGNVLATYAQLDAAYGSNTSSIQSDPMLTDPAAANFALMPGSPAIKAGYGGVDVGAVPFAAK